MLSRRIRASKLLLASLLLAASATEAQIVIRPGEYEVTLNMDLGIPPEAPKAVMDAAGFKGQKRRECITADDVKGDVATWFARETEDQNCKMSNVKTVGNRLTFTTTCEEDDFRMVTNTDLTFGTDSFTGVTTGKDPEGRMTTTKMSAKRIGECPK